MSDPRFAPPIGDMNSLRDSKETPVFDQSNVNGMAPIHEAIERSLAPDVNLEFPLRAICLYAKRVPIKEEYNGGWSLGRFLGADPFRVMVYARIPELDAAIPFPQDISKIVNATDLSQVAPAQKKLIIQHNVFFGNQMSDQQKGYMAGSTEIPQTGDIILVDFRDRKNFVDGVYIGIEQSGGGSIADSTASSSEAFNTSTGMPSFVSNTSGTPAEGGRNPDPKAFEELCPGPLMTSPAFGEGEIETVLIDGTPVAVTDSRGNPIAEYFLAMYNDANSSPGVSLRLNSGFRADDDIDTREAAAECGDTGFTKAGQTTLWMRNCPPKNAEPKEYSSIRECDPVTGTPGGTRGAHRNGYGFDVSNTNPGSEYKSSAAPIPTATYKWLMDNAHKYGFIRTVPTERWHWEYHGSGANRFKIASSHYSWDNYFTSGEGQI